MPEIGGFFRCDALYSDRSVPGFQKIAASVVITRPQDLKFQKALVFSLLFHS